MLSVTLYGQALLTKYCVSSWFDIVNSRINDLSILLIYYITYRYNVGISCVVHQVSNLYHQQNIKLSGIAHILFVYYIYWTCVLQRSTNKSLSEFKQVQFYTAFFFKSVMQHCSVNSSFYYSYISMTGWDLEAKVRSLTHYDAE
jgi:hypothetical protein